MSNFFHWWVIILTMANILGCFWLIWWAGKKRPGEASEGDVTGHIWDDDLQECNNPMPSWWLGMFYITLVFSLAYLALYPGLGNFAGFFGWTQENQFEREVKKANETYGPVFAQYAKQDIVPLSKDKEALRIGQRLFSNYCATCHGSDAGGAAGFPNLSDNDWLWGGDPKKIEQSILDGRRAVMPAWEATLGQDGVEQVTAYVMSLSGRRVDAALRAAGKTKFAANCAACHMPDGRGNQALGAPNLADNIWLYGRSHGVIKQSIAKGRSGVMPANRNFLGEDKAHLLAAYVYSLSAD